MSRIASQEDEVIFWWKIELGSRRCRVEGTSMDCIFGRAEKLNELKGLYGDKDWYKSIFKPGLVFKIICPNNDERVVENLDQLLYDGEQVKQCTILTPKDMKKATVTIQYGEMVNISFEVEFKQRPCTIDSPRSDKTRDDSGIFSPNESTPFSQEGTPGSATPLSNEGTPRRRPRATSSPPISRPNFGEPKPSE